MKLKKAYLQSFGKFVDTQISFSPNLNLIYGENESGKSTLGKFIFYMLYGQKKYGVKKRIYLPDHKRYLPWGSPLYQGILQYSLGENVYRIERNFHSDFEKIKIFYENTGQEITNSFHYDARKELQILIEQIGLNEKYFKNTIYVGQNEMVGLLHKNKDCVLEELLGKTIYGVDGEQGEKTIREIIKGLEKRKKEIGTKNSKNKPIGSSYSVLREKLQTKYELERKLHFYNEYRQSLIEISQQLGVIREEKERLEAQKNYLNKKIIKNKIHTIEKLLEEKQELESYIEKNFCNIVKEISLEEFYKQKKIIYKNEKSLLLFTILMAGIVAILTTVIFISGTIWFFPLLMVFIFFFIWGILKWKNTLKEEEQLFYQIEKANQYQDALNELQRLGDRIENQIYPHSLQELRDKYSLLEEKEAEVVFNGKLSDIENSLEELNNKEHKLIHEKTLYKIKIQEQNWNPSELEEVERDISQLEKTIEDLEESTQAIDVAISTFEMLEKDERLKWLPQIIKKTEENIYKITKKYHTIKIDDQYQIKTLDPKTQKLIPIEQLSQGTFNQFYFSIRLSLIQVLSPQTIYFPIILDEPFIHFDNKRFEESMDLLMDLSAMHQVIIFTSQEREKKYLDQNHYQYHYIEL